MDKQSEFLKRLAVITDSFDKQKFKSKQISLTITLDSPEYDDVYKVFTKKRDDDVNSFSIFMDEYEILIKTNS